MKLEFRVTKRQGAFLKAEADEVLFGGAAGGGKSYGQLIDAFTYAMKYPGSKQILFRRTYPELEKSIIRMAHELYPRNISKYHKTEHSYTFINGSILDFGYIDSTEDVYKYQSAEYDVIRFDELTHFTEQMYVYMMSRLRGANDFPKSMKSSTNPGLIGHVWVKERFVDIGLPDTVHKLADGTRVYIPAKVTDNKYLLEKDPRYVQRLQNLDTRNRKALLEGCWDITDGVFFPEIDRGIHVVSAFDIPADWNRYFVMDYGLDMLAGYCIAVSPSGWCYVYRELYEGKDSGGTGLIVSDAAARIKELVGKDKILQYYAPPDLWNRQKDTGKSIAQLFYEQGIPLARTQNERVQGWFSLKELLKVCNDESGRLAARLRIFGNCIHLIRCITSIQVSEKDPNDVALQPHELTHSVDAMRYFAAAHYRAPKQAPKSPVYNFSFEKPKRQIGRGEKIKII
ncbi:MAG: phage terminase large subunit [Clostridia bacterium]|nr:phage terminase large subunit [Clostridia bacterium]